MVTNSTISPIDGSQFFEKQTLDFKTASAKLAAMKQAQRSWAERPMSERIALVLKAVSIVGENTEQMAQELAHQMGRPVRYGGEFRGFEERATKMAELAEEALAPIIIEDSASALRKIEREPRGLVFVIAPWNYPYMTAINTIAPALIAGNSVALKHSTQTLLVGERLAEAFHQAGISEEVFQTLVLDHATVEELIAKNHFDFINFTGSVEAGRAIERAAAGTFTPVSTELGGKDPGYVRHDADVNAAAEGLIDGAMFNSGQCCCGIERIYVHESCYESFLSKAVEIVNGYTLGNPLDEKVTIGPMANLRFARLVRSQIEEAIKMGAKAHISPLPGDDGGIYLSPQILTNVTHDMRVMREETFGPVVGIVKVRDDEEAIRLMNDSDFGLTASIWTKDVEAAKTIGTQLETGTVFMNRCDYLDPSLCWSGCKDTGNGGGLSIIGYHNLTRPKSYHLRKV